MMFSNLKRKSKRKSIVRAINKRCKSELNSPEITIDNTSKGKYG